ncbi:MAG: insulinase family protein, partial [Oscillospiraceae bacterium]|nr:insulinase family protein [Oscillospiraceae bacterium]
MGSAARTEIMPFVNLTCIRTNKFKTGCMSVNLLTKLDRSTASQNALIPHVLRRGTAAHPDMEAIAKTLDELYGARIEPIVRKRGEVQSIGFYADFADDDFLPDGESVLERTCELMGEILLSPKTRGGRLVAEYVDSERTNLIDDIRSDINDKRHYAMTRLIETMCSKEAYGTPRLGTEATAKKITAAGLTKRYMELLESSAVEIIYCGSADEKRVSLAVKRAFAGLPRGEIARDIGTEVLMDRAGEKVRIVTERLDVTQGKLAIGFRLGEIMAAPNYAAIAVFNAIYGASATSKLFMNVRERLSLCYYA